MEQERAFTCGRVCLTGVRTRGFSPMFVTAGVAGIVLVGAIFWQMHAAQTAKTTAMTYTATAAMPTEESTDDSWQTLLDTSAPAPEQQAAPEDLTPQGMEIFADLLDSYANMQQAGTYTAQEGIRAAEKLASSLKGAVEYERFSTADITTDNDVSYERMMQYREALQRTLSPLLENKTPEYELFARYIETGDSGYLDQLRQVATRYRAAASASATLTVPKDALAYHVTMLNSLQQFAATLDAMAASAKDPFATVALLRSYNDAETAIMTSFNALASYYRGKSS